MSDPTPGSWKHTSRPAGGRGAPRGASHRPWHQEGRTGPPAGVRTRSRFGRFLLVALLAAAIVALIVLVVWLLRRPTPPALVVVGPDAPEVLAAPENVAGANEAAALAAWLEQGGPSRPQLAAPAADTADRNAWQGKLDPRAKATVLYFTAHGGADARGPYLWFVPAAAAAPADAHKLYVTEVLDRLNQLPPKQPKLLVLDAARTPASWPHGLVFNDFAAALRGLEPDVARVPNLAVICSADEDQRAWVSEEWRSSVFGHHFLEALKGAGGAGGDAVTAARAFAHARAEVGKWAVANRAADQTPFLLPAGAEGEARAAAVPLSVVPVDGYARPGPPDPPAAMTLPADLEAAWQTAAALADRPAPPDTLDPVRWRKYLDLLLRWERLVRIGAGPAAVGAVQRAAEDLAARLQSVHDAEPACLAVAVPVGRALACTAAQVDDARFAQLWTPPKDQARLGLWRKLVADRQAADKTITATALRVAVADQVVRKVLAAGPTAETLATAEAVLDAVAEGRPLPAEAHYLRMLHRWLPSGAGGPDADVIRKAIEVRRQAEEVAWVGGAADPAKHPYAEQVFRWTRGRVDAGDAARRQGEDRLFHADPAAWKTAEENFDAARSAYRAAQADAAVVADALRVRDRVQCRIPYYARWVAAHRGLPPGEYDAVFAAAEKAAGGAHQLTALVEAVPDDPAKLADYLARKSEAGLRPVEALAALTDTTRKHLTAVEKAFQDHAAALTGEVQPTRWHALDNALAVPFLAAKDRARVFRHLRQVSHKLAVDSEQLAGARAERPPPAKDLARRQAVLALAVLGEGATPLRTQVDSPPADWRPAYRAAGDEIGKKFRAAAADIEAARGEAAAAAAAAYRGAAPALARVGALARKADPAAPADDAAPAADRRFWRHYFLLWQADRATDDGWAAAGAGPVNAMLADPPDATGYCTEARDLLVTAARAEAPAPDGRTDPAEEKRRLADLNRSAARKPPRLVLAVPKDARVCDETRWKSVTAVARWEAPGGLPVWWAALKSAAPPVENAPRTAPFATQESADRAARRQALVPGAAAAAGFDTVRTGDVTATGELVTTVLHRGHRYEGRIELAMAGVPTRDLYHVPGTGPAAFAVLADPEAVAGAVTILLDLSGSMDFPRAPGGPKKIAEAIQAIRTILDGLPRGTTLTVAGFWRTGDVPHVEPLMGLAKKTWERTATQTDEVKELVGRIKAVPNALTPLAEAIRRVTAERTGPAFWPNQRETGTRTLVVLTDGMDTHDWTSGGDDAAPGRVVKKALLEAGARDQGAALHLVFFALPDTPSENDPVGKRSEAAIARAQFKPLEDREAFESKALIPPEVNEAADLNALVGRLRAAFIPLVYYTEEQAVANRLFRRLRVTLDPKLENVFASPPLAAGTFNLWNLGPRQQVRFEPGDRLLLDGRAGRAGGRGGLTVPPIAWQLADQDAWTRGEVLGPKPPAIHLTLPQVKVPLGTTGYKNLSLVATLEPAGGDAGAVLSVPRPVMAWFEVDYPEGQSRPKDSSLRVRNHPGLLAPAWDLHVERWDLKGEQRPAVTGYWVDAPPAVAAKLRVEVSPTTATPLQSSVAVGGTTVKVVGTELESVPAPPKDGDGLPGGKYLVVRLEYEPGKLVYAHTGGRLKAAGGAALCERHAYFELLARYTVRFGPFADDQLKGVVEVDLYPVAELKDAALANGRAARLVYPPNRSFLSDDSVPRKLKLDHAGGK